MNKILTFLLLCSMSISAQVYRNQIADGNLRSARITRQNWELSYPVCALNDENPLVLSFNDLSSSARSFVYKIVHCNSDWTQSRLAVHEFMDGFEFNPIFDYSLSFNTLLPYTHYRVEIPNDDVSLKVSGNYVVQIFDDSDTEQPLLSLRFSLYENILPINASVIIATNPALQATHHQINLSIETPANILNPAQEIIPIVRQNNLADGSEIQLKPVFIRPNFIDYTNSPTSVIAAQNEYRRLDLKSIARSSTPVRSIEFIRPTYNFFLDVDRVATSYFSQEDFNGKYSILSEKATNPETEADYVWAHFAFAHEAANEPIFVLGDFNQHIADESSQMTYNKATGLYEKSILLKQGYYNYDYFKNENGKIARISPSFAATENDYLLYVYLRQSGQRYDRLVGVRVLNRYL